MRLTNPRHRRPARRGFSLSELMIALGIFAVGLTTGMALFPAALKNSEKSTRKYNASVVGRNGLAIAQAKLTHPLWDSGAHPDLEVIDSKVNPGDRVYPIYEDPSSIEDSQRRKGFILLARSMDNPASPVPGDYQAPNDYQLVAVAFNKLNETHTVQAVPMTATVNKVGKTYSMKVADSDLDKVPFGSLVVLRDGSYAFIADVDTGDKNTEDDNTLQLDRAVPGAVGSHQVFAIVAKDSGGDRIDGFNPGLGAFSVRTGLRLK
ncbi:MAG: prepilin-type N-terminal cleavage/methylation domain-containing protein [Phycisphaerae bacterium]